MARGTSGRELTAKRSQSHKLTQGGSSDPPFLSPLSASVVFTQAKPTPRARPALRLPPAEARLARIVQKACQPGNVRGRTLVSDKKVRVALLSVGSNSLLIALKLAVGLHTGSVSVISEAVHSSIDLLAAIIALFAVRASSRPPDVSHPYGHGKVENLSGVVEAVLIFAAAVWISVESVRKLVIGVHLEALDLGLLVMLLSVAVNIVVSRRLMVVASRTQSIALEADARHLTADILTSAGVFIGLLAVRLTHVTALDPLIAIGVATMIMRTAYDLTSRSLRDLVDTSLPADEQSKIVSIIRRHSVGLREFHKLRSRRVGGQRHVDLHLVVDGKTSVEDAHGLCSTIEEDIRRALPDTDIVIHLEPQSEAVGEPDVIDPGGPDTEHSADVLQKGDPSGGEQW